MNVADLAPLAERIHHREGVALANLATLVDDGVIVEVGSYKGASACYLARGASVPVHCVDLWDIGGQRHPGDYAGRDVFAAFVANTERANVEVTPHKGASVDVAKDWTLPIGLLFIDAEHTYDAVTADLKAWTPHLLPGALVAFHDYSDRFPGVKRAVDEFARDVTVVDRLAWLEV